MADGLLSVARLGPQMIRRALSDGLALALGAPLGCLVGAISAIVERLRR